jgi:two-component system, chemotaxis family, chemotaxis protein CheY
MRILIVDDDIINQKLLNAILADFGTVDLAENGEEAIALVKNNFKENKYYDIIFLDIMMPVMNGHETLREIRRLEEQEGIHLGNGMKIVMVTALGNKENVLSAFSEGCEYYIVKPIRQEKIVEIMAEIQS